MLKQSCYEPPAPAYSHTKLPQGSSSKARAPQPTEPILSRVHLGPSTERVCERLNATQFVGHVEEKGNSGFQVLEIAGSKPKIS